MNNTRLRPILSLLPPLVAFIVQWQFWSAFQPFVWFLFYPAVFFSAWIGGLRPGLISTALSATIVWWFFIPPQYSFSLPAPMAMVSIVLFCIMGGLFSLLLERLKNSLRQAEVAQRTSEQMLAFLKLSHTGGWNLDLFDHTAYRTPEHDRIFGYQSLLPQWTYEMFLEHVLPEDRAEVDRLFNLAVASKSDWSFECRILRVDGEMRWIWAAGGHQRDNDDKHSRMIGIVQDITEKKCTELEILKLNETLGQHVAERTAELESTLKTLHDSEARYRLLVDGVKDVANIMLDVSGRVITWNQGAERLKGYTAAQIIGQHFSVFYPAEVVSSGRPENELVQALARGKAEDEGWRVRRDGSRFWAHVIITPLYNDTGQLQGYSKITRDISVRKEALDRLRASEEKLSVTLNAIGDGVLATDAGGRVTLLNPVAEQLTGWSKADALGRTVDEIFHIVNQQTRQPSLIPVMETLAHGTIQGLANHTVLIARDGGERAIADSCAPIRDRNNQVVGAVLVFRDVTEEYAVQQALRDSTTRIQTIFNTVADGIITINEQGRVETINPAGEHLFGYRASEVVGQNVRMLMPEPDRSQHDGYLAQYLSTGEAKIIGRERGVTGQRKDGSTFPMYLAINEMRLSGTLHFTGIVRDITERQEYEQQLISARESAEQANQAKDSFLATMSHEIRTPLAGMLGMLEVLSLSSLDQDQHKTLHAAWDSARSLLRIVNDILDWSRIQEGKLALAPQSTSVPQLLQEVVNTYSHIASAKSLVLWQHSDSRLSAAHIVDPLRLSQVLNNFVSNAVKFTPHGEIELRAELLERLESGERIRFSVKDTGIGIKREIQESVFRRFQQGAANTARQYGGTGLGLSICRSLAQLLDGQVELASEPGLGSTFSITVVLPVSAAPGELIPATIPVVEQRIVKPLLDNVSNAPLVLAVDDHPTNRDLLARQIELLGLRAETAEDGNAALSLWREGRFALVITDCHMPEMDGYALARAIRKIESEERRPATPIIAWTANALAEEQNQCHAAGMDELLVKPTDLTLLKKTLAKWLSLSETGVAENLSVAVAAPDITRSEPVDYLELSKIIPDKTEQLKVLQEFQFHIQNDLSKLMMLLDEHDLVNAERMAHRMKGSCRMVGATRMTGACAAIEQAARNGNIEQARNHLTELNEAGRIVQAHLSEINEMNGAKIDGE
jgi:PAS domain S-box-containing protein